MSDAAKPVRQVKTPGEILNAHPPEYDHEERTIVVGAALLAQAFEAAAFPCRDGGRSGDVALNAETDAVLAEIVSRARRWGRESGVLHQAAKALKLAEPMLAEAMQALAGDDEICNLDGEDGLWAALQAVRAAIATIEAGQ